MIIGFTGHRPPKVGPFEVPNPIYNKICKDIENNLIKLKPEKIISGYALGIDQYAVDVAHKLGIPIVAAIPFKGQELYWPKSSRDRYFQLLSYASEINYVSPGGYASWKMQVRNEWIVNMSDLLIAYFDGSHGGTYNCVKYAQLKNKRILVINPNNIIL